MSRLWDLITDNTSVLGKLVTTVVIIGVAAVISAAVSRLAARRSDDRYRKYYTRKVVHFVVGAIALVGVGILWRPFAGQLGLVLGLITAGLALGLQGLIGALAGWLNIVTGQIYKVGDLVEVGGVRGDVLDISPLRTKFMEIGSNSAPDAWVRGRQYTGRIVTVSNNATFTDPVFNYSGAFEFVWEEVMIPVAYRDDWRLAEQIMHTEAVRISATDEAIEAINAMIQRYPVARTEVEPRVFVRATDNYLELAARLIVPVRTARSVNDQLTRRILTRFEENGISVASSTQDLAVRFPAPTPPTPPTAGS